LKTKKLFNLDPFIGYGNPTPKIIYQ